MYEWTIRIRDKPMPAVSSEKNSTTIAQLNKYPSKCF